jgi:predicted nucleotidyltransferase
MGEPNDDVLLARLVRALGGVPGIRAIVLGGSRARGEAAAHSDYDIGLYYEADNPIDTGRLAKAAMLLPGRRLRRSRRSANGDRGSTAAPG